MTKDDVQCIEEKCKQFRVDLLVQLNQIQTGHAGGSLSSCEIITTLYDRHLRVDPRDPKKLDRDRFILGKGHAAPMLYLNLAEKGFFPKEDFQGLRQITSHLQGHPCMNHTHGVDISTGPLGLGLSAGLGIALALKLDQSDKNVYVLMGDGEIQEGIIWEAAMAAAKFKADNLIGILDNNGVQLDGITDDIMPLMDVKAKWQAFGWHVIDVDGHDVAALDQAIIEAKAFKGQPILLNCKTVKGKGVSFMEGKNIWHGKPIDDEHLNKALADLGVM